MSDVESRVKAAIAEQLSRKAEDIDNSASYAEDLGADSLDLAELVMTFESDFKVSIPDEALVELTTVQKTIDYINERLY